MRQRTGRKVETARVWVSWRQTRDQDTAGWIGDIFSAQAARKHRLSSITLAPCRKVMGVGPAFTLRAVGSECNLIVLDACDALVSPSGVRVSTRKVK